MLYFKLKLLNVNLKQATKFQFHVIRWGLLTFDALAAALEGLDIHIDAASTSPLIFRQVTIQTTDLIFEFSGGRHHSLTVWFG